MTPDISILPAVNAGLNTATTLLVLLGYLFARQKAITGHTMTMLGACVTSTLFLISYLYYHYHHGSTRFQGEGWVRPVYFFILITHTVLAAAIVPMVLISLYQGLRGNFQKHVTIARVTLPVWLYVSVSGVIIYWMLYHVYAVKN